MYRWLAPLWRTAKSVSTNACFINPEQRIAREDWAGAETLPANYRGTAEVQEKCTTYGTQSKFEHLTYGPKQFTQCTAKRLQRDRTEKPYIMYLIKLPLPLLHSTLQNHSMRSTLPTYTPPILHLIGKAERWEVFFNTLLTGHLTGLWHAALEGVELNMSRGKITPEPFF